MSATWHVVVRKGRTGVFAVAIEGATHSPLQVSLPREIILRGSPSPPVLNFDAIRRTDGGFGPLICCVERWKEFRRLYHAVREPLVPSSGEQCVSKVIVKVLVVGGKAACTDRGRTALQQKRQKREFNPTKGFPGEDIQAQ